MKRVFALVDCNNFFVSCERVFNPSLKGIPVVVLSNNDGCIVARSDEAKQIGLRMAEPVYKSRSTIDRYNVEMLSGNHRLYSDMSSRVMETLERFSPVVDIYSIDEAFLDATHIPEKGREVYAKKIRDTLYKWTGIPASIGIADTKTLAKLASHLAKENGGVCDLSSVKSSELDEILKEIDVREVWGIGYRSSKMLNGYGVRTAHNFKSLSEHWIRRKMGVNGVKVWRELHGTSVSGIRSLADTRKSIAHTRSFKGYVSKKEELESYVSQFASAAARKLRSENLVAGCVTIFARTNYHRKDQKQYSSHVCLPIGQFTSYTPEIIKVALKGLESIFKDGYQFKKAGVILTDIRDEKSNQYGLFNGEVVNKDVMRAIDTINNRWGKMVEMGIEIREGDNYISNLKSQRYTSSWNSLMEVS